MKQLKMFLSNNAMIMFFIATMYVKLLLIIIEINGSLLPFPGILYPLIFCALTSFLLFTPVFFVKNRKFTVVAIVSIIFTIIFIFDLTYFHYFNSIPSVALLQIAGQVDSVTSSVLRVFKATDLLYFLDIIIAFGIYKFVFNKKETASLETRNTAIFVFLGLMLVFMAFFVDRNRFLKTAMTNVMDNKITTERYGLLGAHFFDIYRNVYQNIRILPDEGRQRIATWVQQRGIDATQNEFTGVAAGKNIIMIQVESLQSFVLGENIEGQEITPNLNRLMLESHNFENHYFQTGAGATSDTDFTINTSYYPLKDSATFVRYGQNDFTSLAKELKDEGYSTYTYHGYNRAFWNRAQTLDSLGYERYFAKESYKNDDVINMGIPDEAFLSETIEYIKNQPKPALSYVITLSSHFPFHLPKELEGLNLTGTQYTDLSFGYLQNINYADRALGVFFEKLKLEGLYDNSLIVLFGDHYAKTDVVDMDGVLFDPSTLEGKEVPLLIKLPNQDSGVSHKNISSHIDVMPTILNLVGAKLESFMFGTDLFSDKEPFFASVGYFGTDTIIGNGKIYEQKSGSNSATCSEWNGSTSFLLLSDCETLINKKTEEQNISDMIVRYNLFDKLQTR